MLRNRTKETGPPRNMFNIYPERVQGIGLQRKVNRLQVLHGTVHPAPEGATVGCYVWHYADGSQHETPIVYGQDVREWWWQRGSPLVTSNFAYRRGDPQTQVTRARVAWTGGNAVTRIHGEELRLYLSTFENPKPDLVVTHLDYVSKLTPSAPFTVAVTVEP